MVLLHHQVMLTAQAEVHPIQVERSVPRLSRGRPLGRKQKSTLQTNHPGKYPRDCPTWLVNRPFRTFGTKITTVWILIMVKVVLNMYPGPETVTTMSTLLATHINPDGADY